MLEIWVIKGLLVLAKQRRGWQENKELDDDNDNMNPQTLNYKGRPWEELTTAEFVTLTPADLGNAQA